MNPRGALIWVCMLGLLGAGCVTGREAAAPGQEAAPVASQTCPESILPEAPLAAADPSSPSLEEAFRKRLELAEGTVEVLGLKDHNASGTSGGAALVVTRPVGTGYCVINTWATKLPFPVEASLAGSWVSPDKKRAILLLELEGGQGAGNEGSRWTVLGTDGHRAWIALGQPPADQLIAPLAALTPKNGQLFLDVQLTHVKRLRLGADGHFTEDARH